MLVVKHREIRCASPEIIMAIKRNGSPFVVWVEVVSKTSSLGGKRFFGLGLSSLEFPLSVSSYYQSKNYCPVLVVLEGSALWENTLATAVFHDQNWTILFGLIVPFRRPTIFVFDGCVLFRIGLLCCLAQNKHSLCKGIWYKDKMKTKTSKYKMLLTRARSERNSANSEWYFRHLYILYERVLPYL